MRKHLNQFIIFFVSIFFQLIPVRKKRWIFGAWQGKAFADNPKYLFEYVIAHHPDIEAVWITKDKSVQKTVSSLGFKCFYYLSLKGLYYTFSAQVCFESEGNWDISPFLTSKTIIIQLWHGVAPKKANWSIFNKNNWTGQYWMVSSAQNKETMQHLVETDDSHMFITGYPRNDVFEESTPLSPVIKSINNKYPNAKKLIYLPTHRNFGKAKFPFTLDDLIDLDNMLKENNYVLLYKPHFHELSFLASLNHQFSNILLPEGETYNDLYSYIKDFDLLISDYSSIIYDFLCSDKPIVLFPYDLESFSSTDAGLFDYYTQQPVGPFCFSWKEVIRSSADLLNNDTWKEHRRSFRNVVHPFHDGNNRQRVFDAVQQIISAKQHS